MQRERRRLWEVMIVITMASLSEHGEFKQLPDGILVKNIDKVQQTMAKWTLLITINKPNQESILLFMMDKFIINLDIVEKIFHEIFLTFSKNKGIKIQQINIFKNIKELLDRFREKLKRTMTRQRQHIGLFNIIGKILKSLFGTAEDTEVKVI